MANFDTRRLFQVYLIDSTFKDRVKCFMDNWTVEAFRLPRTMVKASVDEFPDLQNTGIYFLFGDADDSKQSVYVGQASKRSDGTGLAARIIEHDADDEDWTDVVMLTTTNDSWGPTELCYLEHKFFTVAKEAIGFTILNKQEPMNGNPMIEKISGMEEVVHMGRYFLDILGYDIFCYTGLREVNGVNLPDGAIELQGKSKTCDARAIRFSDGRFIVLKGSKIEKEVEPSLLETVPRIKTDRELKAKLISADFRLVEDLSFKSASSASMFVSGTTQSGTLFWKNKEGIPLKDLAI